ncbi:MAG: PfkB family carbohydrate kinase [Gemmatimonadota bacterium]|nr:MAG: PfkB family carbohydrate kinase [Gemmatimonadota bacterium]
MTVLVVGSIALDSVETPHGKAERVLGGSAIFFSGAATLLSNVQVVGVVGQDYPMGELDFLRERGADLSGVEQADGSSFFWAGRYGEDFSTRETLDTQLGVFADFKPAIPEQFRDAKFVFLGNIAPELQWDVLQQVRAPGVVVCDTMNYWIEGSREALLHLLGRVDVLMVNDSEAKLLAGDHNLVRASRWIREHGPSMVVIKKGEHGAALFAKDWSFFAPGYPLESVFDPTGAGDSFAGGFLGYLAQTINPTRSDYRRAMIYGSVTGSFAVESFSIDRFKDLSTDDVLKRVAEFKEMTSFEHKFDTAGRAND